MNKTMTKQEALDQIEVLKKFIEEEDKKNVITRFPTQNDNCCEIKGVQAFVLFSEEEQGIGYKGQEVSGHKASIFLASGAGDWIDQSGRTIKGYLYWKQKKQEA